MGWMILAGLIGVLLFLIYRAWQVWQTRFANRHEFDPDHLALLIAHREEVEKPVLPVATKSRRSRRSHSSPSDHRSEADPAQEVEPMQVVRAVPPPVQADSPPSTPRKPASADSRSPARRHPMLDEASQRVYQRLRSDLTNHPILANVDVSTLIDATPGTEAPRIHADFVLCKKDFTPAVVIFIERTPDTPEMNLAIALLRQQRLRVLRWSAFDLPEREEMRLQIFKPKSS